VVDNSLFDICDKKHKKLITESWEDLAKRFDFSSGENLRSWFKRQRKKMGLLKSNNKNEKILIISDLHIPDHKEKLVLDIIKDNSSVDKIIMLGDILDCTAVSSWYNEDISILDYELIKAHELLCSIRKITKAKIILVKGNHEERVNTYYSKNAKIMGSAVVETEILYKLANGFSIKYKNKNQRIEYQPIKDIEYCNGRTYIIGDLLVNHPSFYRKDYMKTVCVMYNEKFKDKYPNVNVIIMGHTHQLGLVFAQNGKVLIESGCLCNPMSYTDKDDKPFKMQSYGYVYLEIDDKKVDINSIKLKYLGYDEILK